MEASRRVRMEVVAVVLAIIAVLAVVFIAGQVYKTPAETPAVSVKSELAEGSYTKEIQPDKISFVENKTSTPLAEVSFSGLKTDIKDVDSKIVASSNLMFRSGIFAVRDAGAVFSEARITMKKTGNVNVIFYCQDFDFEKESCPGDWAKSDIPFTQTMKEVTFTVNHFSAYAPGEFGILSEFQGNGVCRAYANNDSILTGNITDCPDQSIFINASNIVFDCQGYSILNSSGGFWAQNLSNITIKNCNVDAHGNGINLININSSSLLNNSVYNALGGGINVYLSSGNLFAGNNVSKSQGSAGFVIDTSSNNHFENNRFHSNLNRGLSIGVGDNNSFVNNQFYNNHHEGATANLGENNSFVNNSFFNNSAHGLTFSWGTLNLFENNSFSNNTGDGLYVSSVENNTFVGNNFSGNHNNGFTSYGGSNSLINNRAFNNQLEGIYIFMTPGYYLINNSAFNNPTGFYLTSTTGSVLENNSAFNNNLGFYVSYSDNATVLNNTAFGNVKGFELASTTNSTIAGAYAYSNNIGFFLHPSDISLTFENSTIAGNSGQDLFLEGTWHLYNRSFKNVLLGPNTFIGDNATAIISPLVIYSNLSSIDYGNMTLSNVSLNGSASLEDNYIYLNSSKIPALNISANVTFRNLPWTSMPQLFKDGARCDDNPALCNITAFDPWTRTLTAQVSSFSNYTTGNASTCFNATDDLYINGNAVICDSYFRVNDTNDDGVIIINKSGIALTLGTSDIFYLSGNGSGKGVVVENKTGVTIIMRNSNSPHIGYYGTGIYVKNSRDITLYSPAIGDSDTGLLLYNSTNVIVQKSSDTIYCAFESNTQGIVIYLGGNNSINSFDRLMYNSYGINVTDSSGNRIISNYYSGYSPTSVGDVRWNSKAAIYLRNANNLVVSGMQFTDNTLSFDMINSTNISLATFPLNVYRLSFSNSSMRLNSSKINILRGANYMVPLYLVRSPIIAQDSELNISGVTFASASTLITLLNSTIDISNSTFSDSDVGIAINKTSGTSRIVNNSFTTPQNISIYAEDSSGIMISNIISSAVYYLYSVNSNSTVSAILNNLLFSDSSSRVNATNLTFPSANASISYLNVVLNGTINTSSGVYLLYNLSGIDPSISPGLNASAQVTLRFLPWPITPFVEKDGVRCDNTSSCSVLGYDNSTGTLVFNVMGFSNYSSSNPNLPGTPDTTPPTPPAVYDGLNFVDFNWTGSNTTLYASWNGSFDRSNIFYSYRIMDKNGSCYNGQCAFQFAGSAQQITVSNLSLAICHNYLFKVQAEDTFYNVANLSSSDGITIEIENPTVLAIDSSTHPSQSIFYPKSTVRLNWSASDTNLTGCSSGIAGYSYLFDQDSGSFPDGTIETNDTNATFTNVPSGTWYFHIRAVDNAGNAGDTLVRTARVNVTEVSVNLNPSETPTLLSNATIYGSITKNSSDLLKIYKNDNNTANISISQAQTAFNFTVNLDMGINTIYANASLNGSVAAKSNTLYIRRANETRLNATGFTVSYSGGTLTDSSASSLVSTASANSNFGIGKSAGRLFLFVTSPSANIAARTGYVTNNTLFDQINPSVGFPLEIEQNMISTILNYQDIHLEGNQSVQTGRYTLVITNNGTVGGKPQILVRIT